MSTATIKGYRTLSQLEVSYINKIKSHAEATKQLIAKVKQLEDITAERVLDDEAAKESKRCARIAEEALQQGYMWLVRSIALPENF